LLFNLFVIGGDQGVAELVIAAKVLVSSERSGMALVLCFLPCAENAAMEV
jgi:hypothetical protein